MRFRTWPVAALGLGSLLVLVIVSVLTASRKAQEIYTQLDQRNAHHRNVDAKLRRLRGDVQLSGIFVRDYLLDPSREHAPEYRQNLADLRAGNLATVSELADLARRDGVEADPILSLHAKLDDYWEAFEPLFDWTPAEKQTLSAGFLRRQVLPRREAVLAIAQQVEELNNTNLETQSVEVARRHDAFRTDLRNLVWRSLLLGLIVAVAAVVRLRILEGRSEHERAVVEGAEQQMRTLSQQLVATQEEERKKLSRELHDHVGQMLTALRLELGRVDRLRKPVDNALGSAITECRQLVDDVVRVVRDLSLGLRPSMLDDFGLQPALEWLVRDVTRRSAIAIELNVDRVPDDLGDQHRTCIYRIVQEALTNCLRHSHAEHVTVSISGGNDGLDVFISDDGVGLNRAGRSEGLGLRGMEERVKELHGQMWVQAPVTGGTTLRLHLPLTQPDNRRPLARVAG